MQRVARDLVVIVLIGAVFNIATAWCCAAWSGPFRFNAHLNARWRHEEPPDSGRWIDSAWSARALDIIVLRVPETRTITFVHRAGYPFRSMQGLEHEIGTQPSSFSSAVPLPSSRALGFQYGSTWKSRHAPTRLLPLRPIYAGCVYNTLLSAGALALLVYGWRFARRTLRVLQGRCAACGYVLREAGLNACSECGWHRGRPATRPSGWVDRRARGA
ncbi:MAG: hypothetical protein ACYSU7_10055 [Planctomycetota bacterium]|jgi:hypothetical protein